MQNTLVGYIFIASLELDAEAKADLNAFMSTYTVVQLVLAWPYIAAGVYLRAPEPSSAEKGSHSEVTFHGVPAEEPKDLRVDVGELRQHKGLVANSPSSVEMQAVLPEPPSPPAQPENGPATFQHNGGSGNHEPKRSAEDGAALQARDSAEIMLIETLRKDFGDASGAVPRGVSYKRGVPSGTAANVNMDELVAELPAEFGFRNHIVYDDNAQYEPDDGHIRYFNPDVDS